MDHNTGDGHLMIEELTEEERNEMIETDEEYKDEVLASSFVLSADEPVTLFEDDFMLESDDNQMDDEEIAREETEMNEVVDEDDVEDDMKEVVKGDDAKKMDNEITEDAEEEMNDKVNVIEMDGEISDHVPAIEAENSDNAPEMVESEEVSTDASETKTNLIQVDSEAQFQKELESILKIDSVDFSESLVHLYEPQTFHINIKEPRGLTDAQKMNMKIDEALLK